MSRRELYGKKALECVLAAGGMATAENRLVMLKLAQCWMRLGSSSEELAEHLVTAFRSGAATAQGHHIS